MIPASWRVKRLCKLLLPAVLVERPFRFLVARPDVDGVEAISCGFEADGDGRGGVVVAIWCKLQCEDDLHCDGERTFVPDDKHDPTSGFDGRFGSLLQGG